MKTIKAVINPEQAKLVASNNEFALKLYKILKSEDKNLFFSPLSISICLAMAYTGARSATAEQMASVLNFEDQPALNTSFNWLINNLNDPARAEYFELQIANALWMQEDYKIFPEYLNIVEKSFLGGIFGVDFKKQAEAVRKTINKWVEERTNDKIQDLIKPNMIDPLTRLILTNAIYFFSKWEKKFKTYATRTDYFTLIDGQKVKIPLMYQKNYFFYIEKPDFQAIEVPYFAEELSMVIFLPKRVDGIDDMEDSITAENMTGWINRDIFQEVKLFLPKFKFTSEFSLGKVLNKMGMFDAFDQNKADFSGITPKDPDWNLFIGEVLHKTFIDVDEEGTEAAAATPAIATLGAAIRSPKPVPTFRADHPFMFLIRDISTNSILFLGRIMDAR